MPTTVEPARAQRAARRTVVVVLGCAAALFAITTFIHQYGLADLAVHHAAVRSWADGDGLYTYRSAGSGRGATLPPMAALALAPVAFLPLWTAGMLLGSAGVGALVLALIALVGPVARRYRRRRWPAVFAAAALALTLEPVRATIGRGDLDLLVFGLITADVVALRRGAWERSRVAWWPGRPVSAPARGPLRRGWGTGAWVGAGTGLATALTVGPVLFLGYFAVTRQWRAAVTGVATAVALLAATALVAPHETAAWAGEVLWHLDGVDNIGNQSLAGVLARLYDSATTPLLLWFSFALLVGAVGMIRARAAHADGDEIAACTLVGLTGAIVGPLSDTHELIWVLPAILILVDAAAARRAIRPPPRRPRPPHPPRPRRSWSCGWPYAAFRRFCSNQKSKIAGKGRRGLGYAVAAALVYLLFVTAPIWSVPGPLAGNAYALALILLVNAVPWRPLVAPAFPINRWTKRSRRPQPIPPARRPVP
jgi:alpha-1,2-mannosyltransferase